ncbi:hypothetical protein Tco_0643494 [Tanacetum coccineum]
MVARRCVRFSEMMKESACGDGHDVIVDSSKVEHSPQAVAKCAVHDDGTRPVHGRNDTRFKIPKSKLVYRAVVKPQGDKNVASNMGQSLDTTKKPSPSDSSMNG